MLTFWDEKKRASNLALHGLDFADARDRFEWATAIVGGTRPGSDGRPRLVAIGLLDRKLVTLVFSLLGSEAISLISLRAASRSERRHHAER